MKIFFLCVCVVASWSTVVREIISFSGQTGVIAVEEWVYNSSPARYDVTLHDKKRFNVIYTSEGLSRQEINQVLGHYNKQMWSKFTVDYGSGHTKAMFTNLPMIDMDPYELRNVANDGPEFRISNSWKHEWNTFTFNF